jgi:hypothetical protein
MPKKLDSQLSFDLSIPVPLEKGINREKKADCSPEVPQSPQAEIYSLSQIRIEADQKESAKHFQELIRLVRHFR